MNLKHWLAEGKLTPHKATREEIQNLLELAKRDIQNASISDLSPDWQFSIAYNAVLNLASIPLLVSGYRTVASKGGHHYITIASLIETVGPEVKKRMHYFNVCRNKRHNTTYDSTELISESEATELILEAKAFLTLIEDWVQPRL